MAGASGNVAAAIVSLGLEGGGVEGAGTEAEAMLEVTVVWNCCACVTDAAIIETMVAKRRLRIGGETVLRSIFAIKANRWPPRKRLTASVI